MSAVMEFLKSAVAEQIVGDPVWASLALVGQFIFGCRFIVQWIASERRGRSHVPTVFWWISLLGSTLLLAYSIHIRNPIFMLGFSLNMLIYVRNLHLIHKHSKKAVVVTLEPPEN
jgi:lipid-A-disaccharide synthase-like uncharacterized protein